MQRINLDNRTFMGVFFIPLCYVAASFILDISMFLFMGIAFPSYYIASLMLLVFIAGVVSCIPNRKAQISILGVFLVLQVITSVANVIAYRNIEEIFSIETLFAWREVFASEGAQKYNAVWAGLTFGLIAVAFIAASITVSVLYRKQKTGYKFRECFAVVGAAMIIFSTIFLQISVLKGDRNDYFKLLLSPGYSASTFTNRTKVLQSFGSPLYYAGNVLAVMKIVSMENSPIGDKVEQGWDDVSYYDEYAFMLDSIEDGTPANLIMFMMETVEFNAIDENLMPTLWNFRKQTTWVDGYYSTERTCFSEYVSLTGGNVLGSEMWRDYHNTRNHVMVPQSLPNIFRRAFEDADVEYQIAGFHGYEKEFYGRNVYMPNIGFDFIRDPKSYGVEIEKEIMCNSDIEMMRLMVEDIAPVDKSFFSYVLNATTHAPHFKSANTYPKGDTYETVLSPESLEYVLENYDELAEIYPKLNGNYYEKWATVAYLVSLREFDESVKILLDYLEDNGLMDSTAIVFYSDHYDYMAYGHENSNGGSLLSDTTEEWPVGEKCNFMIYNPLDINVPEGGRRIETFMTNNDVYKTVCHLFNIQTHNNYTLGNSVLGRLPDARGDLSDISIGIRFYNSYFFGMKHSSISAADGFGTYSFKSFDGYKPKDKEMEKLREKMTIYAGTLFKLNSYYDGDKFKYDMRCYYRMGERNASE